MGSLEPMPPIPVVFDRVQDLLALAVKELRRYELPRILPDHDEPALVATVTAGIVNSRGL
jgi:hypothetical protein